MTPATILLLLALTNASRASMHPFVHNTQLDTIAQERAEYLCTHSFSHDGLKDTLNALGPAYNWLNYEGENLAKDFTDPKAIQAAWMASPTHRANILNKHYTAVGFGAACGITSEEFGGTDI